MPAFQESRKGMNVMKINKVGFTKKAIEALKKAGATDEVLQELLNELAKTVRKYPKGKYNIDAFDGLSWAGVRLSWLRDWKKGEALIMTIGEATELDGISGDISNRYDPPFTINFPF